MPAICGNLKFITATNCLCPCELITDLFFFTSVDRCRNDVADYIFRCVGEQNTKTNECIHDLWKPAPTQAEGQDADPY